MPGRFAETLDSVPTGQLEKFFAVVGLDDNFDIFFLGRIPTLAGICRAGREHAKTMQKPCKHAKTMQNAARTLASTTGQVARQPTEHPLSPGSLLYVLYVLHGPI